APPSSDMNSRRLMGLSQGQGSRTKYSRCWGGSVGFCSTTLDEDRRLEVGPWSLDVVAYVVAVLLRRELAGVPFADIDLQARDAYAAHHGDIQMIDSTSVRAHQQAATTKKGGADADHCLGRSRGGLTTKLHAVVDAQGLPIRLGLTTGQAHDGQIADTLLNQLGPHTIVLADKAYDADRIRQLIQDHGATPNIPPKSNRRWKPCFSRRLYRERNLIERFFSKLKHFRRVATRYDKFASNFLAMVQLASMRLWMRANEPTG